MFTIVNSFSGREGGYDTGETCMFDLKSQLFPLQKDCSLMQEGIMHTGPSRE